MCPGIERTRPPVVTKKGRTVPIATQEERLRGRSNERLYERFYEVNEL